VKYWELVADKLKKAGPGPLLAARSNTQPESGDAPVKLKSLRAPPPEFRLPDSPPRGQSQIAAPVS
jgi:hypothetical protein